MAEDVFIGIGSNLGNPLDRCREAGRRLSAAEGVSLVTVSSLYRTEPVGPAKQGWFVNGVCRLSTSLSPLELLRCMKGIEAEMGKRVEYRWGPRVIDLDLLLYGESVVDLPDLQVPHLRMHVRRFVLQPLLEISPDLRHPVLKKSVKQLLSQLKEDKRIEFLAYFEEDVQL